MEADLGGQCSGRDVVCAAERGKKVVESNFIRQIDNREAQAPLVTVAVKEIVVTRRDIKQTARLDSLRIMVVILRPWSWYFD